VLAVAMCVCGGICIVVAAGAFGAGAFGAGAAAEHAGGNEKRGCAEMECKGCRKGDGSGTCITVIDAGVSDRSKSGPLHELETVWGHFISPFMPPSRCLATKRVRAQDQSTAVSNTDSARNASRSNVQETHGEYCRKPSFPVCCALG